MRFWRMTGDVRRSSPLLSEAVRVINTRQRRTEDQEDRRGKLNRWRPIRVFSSTAGALRSVARAR